MFKVLNLRGKTVRQGKTPVVDRLQTEGLFSGKEEKLVLGTTKKGPKMRQEYQPYVVFMGLINPKKTSLEGLHLVPLKWPCRHELS